MINMNLITSRINPLQPLEFDQILVFIVCDDKWWQVTKYIENKGLSFGSNSRHFLTLHWYFTEVIKFHPYSSRIVFMERFEDDFEGCWRKLNDVDNVLVGCNSIRIYCLEK